MTRPFTLNTESACSPVIAVGTLENDDTGSRRMAESVMRSFFIAVMEMCPQRYAIPAVLMRRHSILMAK